MDTSNIKANKEKAKRLKQERQLKVRDRNYKSAYGISLKDVEAMLESQDGKCAVCLTEISLEGKATARVDHCHITGKVRGLLCHKCNVAIGCLGDNINGLQRAMAYLCKI